MNLPDTPQNTSIVYLFVNSFEWMSAADKERNVGHLHSGAVYRALYNKDTKTYRVFYKDETGTLNAIYIPKLIMTEEERESEFTYLSNIVEIRRNNVVELGLTIDHLNEILFWQDEKDKSVKQATELEQQKITPQDVIEAVQQQQETVEFNALGKAIYDLRQSNQALYDALSEMVYFVIESESKVNKGVIDAGWMDFSKILGAGKNIGKAIQHLSVYGSDDRRTNLGQRDLLEAINALLLESTRRRIQNIV